jgi:hypothetical protein
MGESEGIGKDLDTELLERSSDAIEIMPDWLASPEAILQEIEKAEVLITRLLHEREELLEYIRALRFWAYEVIGGSVSMNDQPIDMYLLQDMMKLPSYLRKEIESRE